MVASNGILLKVFFSRGFKNAHLGINTSFYLSNEIRNWQFCSIILKGKTSAIFNYKSNLFYILQEKSN